MTTVSRQENRSSLDLAVAKSEPTLYKYGRLRGPNTIRVLEIHPGESHWRIRCRIQQVSLDDTPSYDAVSYVWGSSRLSKEIYIGARIIRVTENCFLALQGLRDSNLPRFCWIDACCIDQSSSEERNHQVRLMGDVYSKAARTIVCLGPTERNFEHDDVRAIQYIEKYAQYPSTGQYQSHRTERDINHFINKQWFHRVWTVQEFALAQRCIILCGTFQLDAAVLLAFLDKKQNRNSMIDRLQRVRLHQQMWSYIHREKPTSSNSSSSRHEVEADGTNANTAKCTSLLLGARPQSSTDPKDKIFAFQGMLDLLGIQLPAPDYTKSVHRVYAEAAAAAIAHDKSLMLLSSLTGKSLIGPLPSWVPDWSDSDFITEIAQWDERYALVSPEPEYSISDNRCLEIEGVIIDTITYSSQPVYPAFNTLRHAPDQEKKYAARREEIAVLKTWFAAFGDTKELNIAGFFSALVQEAWDQERERGVVRSDVLAGIWIKAIKLIGLTASALHDLPIKILDVLKESDQRPRTKRIIESAIVSFHSTMRKLLDRKRMFRTRKGKLGMGCRALKVGDRIAMFTGCNLPMIIRKAENKSDWRFVCSAFLEDEMRGGSKSTLKLRLKKYNFI